MLNTLRPFFLAGFLLAAVPAFGDNNLPTLPSGGPQSLPSVNTSPLSKAVMPEQTLTVTCYLGNPNDKQSLGSITVNSPVLAGSTCNSFNYSCQGRCFGCYSDFDLSDDVCVDNSGKRFLK